MPGQILLLMDLIGPLPFATLLNLCSAELCNLGKNHYLLVPQVVAQVLGTS